MMYPWLVPVLDQWHQQLAVGRQPQAMIIEGNPGIGKSVLTKAIVAELLCRQAKPEPCGTCQSCRIFRSGQHPDLFTVVSEKDLIKVAAIRSLVQFFTATAHSARHKVAVIEHAHSMNTAAANALLKVLEEPPAGSLLILQTDRMHQLLPTIRSRCVHLKLYCKTDQYPRVKQWLHQHHEQITSEQLEKLWVLSPGLPLQISAMIEQDVLTQLHNHLNQMLDYFTGRQSLVSVSQYCEQHVDAAQWLLIHAILLHWLKVDDANEQGTLCWSHELYRWLFKQAGGNMLVLKLCRLINIIMVNFNNQTKTRLLIESMLVQTKQNAMNIINDKDRG